MLSAGTKGLKGENDAYLLSHQRRRKALHGQAASPLDDRILADTLAVALEDGFRAGICVVALALGAMRDEIWC